MRFHSTGELAKTYIMSGVPGDIKPTRPFEHCPRCRYALKGLPANHACPECGLRYDEQCKMYYVSNPRKALASFLVTGLVIFCVLANSVITARSGAWSLSYTVLTIITILLVIHFLFSAYSAYMRYRSGYSVAIAADGLVVCLPDHKRDFVKWNQINEVIVLEYPEGRPQVVSITLKDKRGGLSLGSEANVFPTLADAQRFVEHVKARMAAAGTSTEATGKIADEAATHSTPESP